MKIKRRHTLGLIATALAGSSMPSIAGVANPRGPEGRPATDRTIRFIGKTHEAAVRIAYPAPDDIVDRTTNDTYDVRFTHPSVLLLAYDYTGFFWQGRFGGVDLRVILEQRKPDTPAWKGIDELLAWVRADVARRNSGSIDMPWSQPSVVEIGAARFVLIRAVEKPADEKSGTVRECFYFPFEDDYALLLGLELVDSSDRPGLTKSNWRPRAEDFREKLLSTIRIKVTPKQAAK